MITGRLSWSQADWVSAELRTFGIMLKLRDCWPAGVIAGAINALMVTVLWTRFPPRYPEAGEGAEFAVYTGSYIFGSMLAWTLISAWIRHRSVSRTLCAILAAPLLSVVGSLCVSSSFALIFAAFLWPTAVVIGAFVYFWLPPRAAPEGCAQCGYSLVGSVSGRCSECGRALD